MTIIITARVGKWNHNDGSVGTDSSAGVNICTDANDSTCSTLATVTGAGAFTLNGTKYFANMTAASPPEYFKCVYTKPGISGVYTTSAHTPPTPPGPVVSASIHSVGGLIFAASGLLLVAAWASRKKLNKNQ